MAVDMRQKPTLRGDDAKRFLENERRANNDIDEARAEAYRKEGDKRTVERIAELLAKRDYCPQADRACPTTGDRSCMWCWADYLAEDNQ